MELGFYTSTVDADILCIRVRKEDLIAYYDTDIICVNIFLIEHYVKISLT